MDLSVKVAGLTFKNPVLPEKAILLVDRETEKKIIWDGQGYARSFSAEVR